MMLFRPVTPVPAGVPEFEAVVADVTARLNAGAWPRNTASGGDGPVYVARAPGRLDVMGGIADYSGSLVLQWPIREATSVAIRPWVERRLSITSVGPNGAERYCEVPLEIVTDPRRTYEDARAWFAADTDRHWAAYVAGVFHVLSREDGVGFAGGAAILVESDVPEGKGVSSSAAIEAATMEAVLGACGVSMPPRTRAVRCQQVENLIVGAPCGIMDQMTSICGEAGSLMALLCQPAEWRGSVRLPDSLRVWGIDSGIRHAVTGADYNGVRVGAFMGYRILADLASLPVTAGGREGHVRVEDTRWHGYLANVGHDAFRQFAPAVPEAMDGREFLARYSGTTDLVTRVDPATRYAVRIPTAHPIFEHERVTEWDRQLSAAASSGATDAARLGELMYESHASYSACGLGSEGTDRLVAMARRAGPSHGVHGAKITGGGSGGTVALLTDAGAADIVHAIAHQYGEETGRDAYVFEGTSPGAARTGAVRLQPA